MSSSKNYFVNDVLYNGRTISFLTKANTISKAPSSRDSFSGCQSEQGSLPTFAFTMTNNPNKLFILSFRVVMHLNPMNDTTPNLPNLITLKE